MDTTQLNVNQYFWHIFLNLNAFGKQINEKEIRLKEKLEAAKIKYQIHLSQTEKEDIETIQSLCKNNEKHFIVIGGDGTLNFFVNAVMKANVDTQNIFIALFPLGTGNDWARSHNIKANDFNVIDDFVRGSFIRHDVGAVDVTTLTETTRSFFINIAGFGFDAQIIKNTKENEYKNRSQMYLLSLLKTLVTYKSHQVCIHLDENIINDKIYSIAVGLNQYNGNGMRQCPHAICDDGLFEVVVIKDVTPFQVVKNVKNLFSGTHIDNMKEVTVYNTDHLVIDEVADFYGEVEGEMLPHGTYCIKLLPKAINLLTALEKNNDK